MNVFARCLAAGTLALGLGGCSASDPARASFATRLYATTGTNDSVMDAAIDEADDRVAIVTTNLDRTAVFLYRLGDGGLVAAYEQDCELDIRVLFSTSAHELVTACRRSRFDASTPAETTFTTFDASSGKPLAKREFESEYADVVAAGDRLYATGDHRSTQMIDVRSLHDLGTIDGGIEDIAGRRGILATTAGTAVVDLDHLLPGRKPARTRGFDGAEMVRFLPWSRDLVGFRRDGRFVIFDEAGRPKRIFGPRPSRTISLVVDPKSRTIGIETATPGERLEIRIGWYGDDGRLESEYVVRPDRAIPTLAVADDTANLVNFETIEALDDARERVARCAARPPAIAGNEPRLSRRAMSSESRETTASSSDPVTG